jgi:XRE family transcriptional regulator, master regulator for biofilm formation
MIGKNIYKIRKKRGLTLSELAERASISKSYLSNIERNVNQNPSIQVLEKIAMVLYVDLKLLLIKNGSKIESPAMLESEWVDFVHELKESGVKKDQLQDYKLVIEFIKWQNRNMESEE